MTNNRIKNGAVGGVLALALLTSAVPTPRAEAATLQDLQAQVQALLAQLQTLRGPGAQAGTPPACMMFMSDLTIGRSGAEVTNLQNFLISRGHAIPAGASGYFGEQTRSALAQFQAREGISPASGYFGPLTRGKVNALCATQGSNPGNGNQGSGSTGNPVTPGSILQGEGTLDTVEIEAADDTSIREAASDAPIAVLTLEADDGDIEVTRLDVALVADSGNAERDPWDTFEEISLWVDGEKIAERKIDNRSQYLNRTGGTIRFTNLDFVLEEGEETEVTVAVNTQNRVSGAGSAANWSVRVDNIRYKDADNVVTTDTTTGDMGDAVAFEIVTRGDGEELKFSTSNQNPIERAVIVDSDKRTNNVTLLSYTIEALGNTIELDTLNVNIETGTAPFNDVVSDVRLKIGRSIFKKDEIVTTGSYSTTSVRAVFDIDNKIEIDEDEKVIVEVIVDLKARTAYGDGETIRAQVTAAERDMTQAEGADDVTEFSGSAIGKVQTLIAEGIFAPSDSVRTDTDTLGSNNTTGVFTIEFDVTAVEGDYYITDKASTSSLETLGGVQYTLDTTVGDLESISAVLTSTADEDDNGVFWVREGTTETFTLTVVVDPGAAGTHRVLLDAIRFSAESDGVTSGVTYTVKPANLFRTPFQFINN